MVALIDLSTGDRFMCTIIPFAYSFEEWALKEDSRQPGWDFVIEFSKNIISSKLTYQLFVFKTDTGKHCSILANTFSSEAPNIDERILLDLLWSSSFFVIKAIRTQHSDTLLHKYELTEIGRITDNQKSTVFFEPIEWPADMHLNNEEILVIAWHDGDPIFILSSV
jgi:hypothetical protein